MSGNLESVFLNICQNGVWAGDESISGHGSSLRNTQTVRQTLLEVIERYSIRSLLDIPCGDAHWMSYIPLDIDEYIGADVVGELIRANCEARRPRWKCRWRFERLDITTDRLPCVDLVFCRDGLVHLPNQSVISALKNVARSGSRLLLVTTFTGERENADIAAGDWRPINLRRPPFSLPAPEAVFSERYYGEGGAFLDKSLGLWQVSHIPRLRFEPPRFA